ncbi:hypothetical protein NPIL_573231 [Nephila pilipes]|uniref:C2H2-type domain-containing protein n=1 Tax=Nephila pilipes TaxID=299642 RepID=A0A8X6QYG8_NEPPI|nr:hypothetical protein NPIL_573231 [Nephila pilipes]
MSSNDCKRFNQTDRERKKRYFDTKSSLCENAFEKFEKEYQSMANYRMSEYQVYQTSPKYSSSIKDSEREVQEIDIRNDFPHFQGYITEEIPNSIVKCCDSNVESCELKQENLLERLVTLSAVGRCIRNACDSLLGMDPYNTDHLLENTSYQFMDFISFDSKGQASVSEVEFLDGNAENKSEITSEKLESEKYQFKHDSSLSRLLCNKSSEISTEEGNFNPRINKYGMYEQMILQNDYQPSFTGKKAFQCEVCQRTFTRRGHLNRHLLTHSEEKPFECDVCQRTFARKDSLFRHMHTQHGENTFHCEVCQRSFSRADNLNKHKRMHNEEKHS